MEWMKSAIINAYSRSNYDIEELEELMDTETWFTAQEAIDAGFIDGTVEGLKAAALITEMATIANQAGSTLPVEKIVSSLVTKHDKQITILNNQITEMTESAEQEKAQIVEGLAADKKIYDLIENEILQVNKKLPENTKISKFLLLFKELEADDGELTRTRKVRRSVINDRYNDMIKDLYSDKNTASINTEFTLEDGRKSKISAEMEIRHLIETKQLNIKIPKPKTKKPQKGKK